MFFSFSFGFGNGLWGLLEIVVIAPLAVVALRIACEASILFFKNNSETINLINQHSRLTDAPDLIADVGEAIDELANEVTAGPPLPAKEKSAGKDAPAIKTAAGGRKAPVVHKTTGRTAKRKPPSRPKS